MIIETLFSVLRKSSTNIVQCRNLQTWCYNDFLQYGCYTGNFCLSGGGMRGRPNAQCFQCDS